MERITVYEAVDTGSNPVVGTKFKDTNANRILLLQILR